MNPLLELLVERPLIFVHLIAASGTFLIGIAMFVRRKGTSSHRTLGWAWVLLMATTAISSVFIRDYRLPNLFGYTPIHLLTLTVAILLPWAVWLARRGRVAAHRRMMTGLYTGGSVIAGLFALAPGRFLGQLLRPALAALS